MTEELSRLRETKTASEEMFRGSMLRLQVDMVELPNGKPDHRELVRHNGAVAVCALTDDGCVVTERQFRYPVDAVLTELPAGKLNGRDEDPLEAAKRELREETGYTADRWTPLGSFYPAAAYSDEKIELFLAQGLHPGACQPDEDEFIEISPVPLEELKRQVLAGEIPDAKTQALTMRVWAMLHSQNGSDTE